MRFNVPSLELCVSASTLIFGILLATKNRPNLWLMIVLGAIAGLFHGYAYAESIFGAEMTPLVALLFHYRIDATNLLDFKPFRPSCRRPEIKHFLRDVRIEI